MYGRRYPREVLGQLPTWTRRPSTAPTFCADIRQRTHTPRGLAGIWARDTPADRSNWLLKA
jgi:hypothetical protein